MRRILTAVALAILVSAAAGAQTEQKLVQPQMTITKVPVTDAPYCGQENFEHTQKLADGTNIDRKLTTAVCRDSQGRERRENDSTITITDPVERASYHIDKANHTVTRSPMGVLKITYDKTPSATLNIVTGNVTVVPLDGAAHVTKDGTPAAAGGSRGGRGGGLAPTDSGETKRVESLGIKMLEGVQVEGTRDVRTIPVGQIGNDRPLQTVWETWFSQELGIVVLRKISDPLNGNTVTEMKDIQRSEPSPSLFQAPAGYTVRDLTQK